MKNSKFTLEMFTTDLVNAHIRCSKCKKVYDGTYREKNTHYIEMPDIYTLIDACPNCRKDWARTKVSHVKWSAYPGLKKMILKEYGGKG